MILRANKDVQLPIVFGIWTSNGVVRMTEWTEFFRQDVCDIETRRTMQLESWIDEQLREML